MLPFTATALLAPMEGVTDPSFRSVMLGLHTPQTLGGSTTEFVRVVQHAVPLHKLASELGPCTGPIPVGIQLMGNNAEALRATAALVESTWAALVDLNFGCPAKGTLHGCAGAAVLRDPREVERLVAATVAGVQRLPVTAKIRAGWDSANQLEVLARAAEQGGAAMLTVHCRTRAEGYCEEVDWSRIARAVAAVRIPVCGNGGVLCHADIERMQRETGCKHVMIGRAALADPWIFSGYAASVSEVFAFIQRYVSVMRERAPQAERYFAGRVKQLVSYLHPRFLNEMTRAALLREADPSALHAWIEAQAAGDSTKAPSFEAKRSAVPGVGGVLDH